MTNADVIAWNLYAKIQKRTLSGYNIFLRDHLNCFELEKTWSKLTNCIVSDVTKIGFQVDINVGTDQEGILYIGTSNKAMITQFEGVFDIDKYTFTVTGLQELTNYYFYIKNTKSGEKARTGIYGQKTSAVEPEIPIDIGNLAIDRASYVGNAYTYLDRNNPANASGKINQIEIFCYADIMQNTRVATFYVVSGNFLSTRSTVVLGTVQTGYSSHIVDLDVVAGDFIGMYFSPGWLRCTNSGGIAGLWKKSGNFIPCVNQEFTPEVSKIISLYGTGLG